MMRTTALSLIRESEAGDAWSGQDREDSAGPLSGGPFDQGDQPGFLGEGGGHLVACSSYLKPSLTGGDEPIQAGRPFERLRLFLVVQFNELQTRLINPPDGIANSSPEPASIKGTLVC